MSSGQGKSRRHFRGRARLRVVCGGVLMGPLAAIFWAASAPDQDRPTERTDFCATKACHADFVGREFVHEPTGRDKCLDCHAHAVVREHTFRLNVSPYAMCIECHLESTPPGVAARRQHLPMADGCTSCHDAHPSDNEFQLRHLGADLCFPCHEGIRSDLGAATVGHGPALEDDACGACHDPHYMRLPTAEKARAALCLDCHNEQIETSDGRMLSDMATLLVEHPNHHGPIRDGNCIGCHEPHANDHLGLLLEQYPPLIYAPFEPGRYTLCFKCHDRALVEKEAGTGLTGFRDGDRNLHRVHVNQRKGRSCRACHEVHASRHPFHIREAVPFGDAGWMLKINYEQTTGGGTCAPGCHESRTYDRNAAAPE
ncbi:MAG: cytochrome c3 family protein [Planctomycetota bacterium]|jgi:predicted CXXCH cytochrome family protein